MSSGVLPVLLYGRADPTEVASAGAAIVDDVRRAKLNPTPRAWDFLAISLAAATADLAIPRRKSPNGWTRELTLEIAVTDPDFWNGVATEIQDALKFLTTDIWDIKFLAGGYRFEESVESQTPEEDCVALLSGGADSLVGVIDLVASGILPFVVSQTVHGDGAKQTHFANVIGDGLSHFKTNHNARFLGEGDGDQRARSMVFFAYATLVASTLANFRDGATIPLYSCENGFISVNPPLTQARTGSLSTRTTHPIYIARLQHLLRASGLNCVITNPYQYKTKGEMFKECLDQDTLKQLAVMSTSCSRFERHGMQHCGRCIPCIIRRAAFHKWGSVDTTGYKYDDLSARNGHRASFDDVRCAAMAIAMARSDGIESLIGATLASQLIGDTAPLIDVVNRGLTEIETFFNSIGVR